MKDIIIAAGYATRLYPLTKNFPKPLLKIGSTSILGRLIADIDTIDDISGHVVVTNHKFATFFNDWVAHAHTCKPIRIIDDGTTDNDNRLGAVRDLLLAIDRCAVDEDILVAAADNILDFSLAGFVRYAAQKGTSAIMCHYEPETYKLQRTGVIAVDSEMRVLAMQEKPSEPVSHYAVPPFYIYKKSDLPLVKECMEHGCGNDAPGNLARYLCGKTVIHAYEMPGKRYDIGSIDSYHEAQRLFGQDDTTEK